MSSNSFAASQINFGVDLRSAALKELSFLKRIKQETWLHNEDVLKVAVHRYEKFWLPFLKKTCGESPGNDVAFAPPTDVHWVWHAHMLSPNDYRNDCLKVFGRVVDHRLATLEETAQKQEKTKVLWNEMFPTEAFELPKDRDEILERYNNFSDWKDESQLEYDIIGSAMRQMSFHYQVSLPHYQKWFFLNEAFLRYKKFLHLKKLHKKELLVPCYDIDLLWHTHQVHPSIYNRDCEKMLKMVLPHDDTISDRSEGSTLNKAYSRTKDLWNKTYSEKYEKPGAMYRGEDPAGKLSAVDDGSKFLEVQTDTMKIKSLVIPRISWHKDQPAAVVVKLVTSSNDQTVVKKLFSGEWTIGPSSKNFQLTSETRFCVRSDVKASIMVEVVPQRSRFACVMPRKIAATPQPGLPVRNSGSVDKQPTSYALEVFWEQEPKSGAMISIELELVDTVFETSSTAATNFSIERGAFYETTMPEDIEAMWGPVPLDKLPDGKENRCNVVSHK